MKATNDQAKALHLAAASGDVSALRETAQRVADANGETFKCELCGGPCGPFDENECDDCTLRGGPPE